VFSRKLKRHCCFKPSLNAGLLELLVVGDEEGLLSLEELIDVLLCAGEEELVPRLLEGGEDVHQLLLLVLPSHIQLLLVFFGGGKNNNENFIHSL
jgi:hypothetical protein